MRERWFFRAIDTWFFRDGTPFLQGEQGPLSPRSHFPPPHMTLQGAIRIALAKRYGWPKRPWPDELGTNNEMGQIRVIGPYLIWNGKWLYPAPHVLFSHGDDYGLLKVGTAVDTDLGKVHLMELPQNVKGGKPLQAWLTSAGMQAVLEGHSPKKEHVYLPKQLWKEEHRIGIGRDNLNRKTIDGQLYSHFQIRPHPDLEVVVDVEGIPPSWPMVENEPMPFGGEGRMAAVRIEPADGSIIPPMPNLKLTNGWIHFTLSLLTPGYVEQPKEAIEKGDLEVPGGIPGELITASITPLQQVGGWDSIEHCSRPLKPILPSGSTWFFRARKEEKERLEQLHGALCGPHTLWGQGQLVIGTWYEEATT
jgi:CRISPR-associated protein Cmr3